jgi:uncharacterized membrane protein YjgN (DUF898 family)
MSNPYDQNPYAQQQSYVQSSPYGSPMAQPHPQGTMILIFGILSLVGIQIMGPIAWVMGSKALKEIDANPAAYSDRGNVNAGRICGIIGTVLMILTVLFIIAYVIFLFVILGSVAATGGY